VQWLKLVILATLEEEIERDCCKRPALAKSSPVLISTNG
jgi:hypothetical protein